MAKKGRKNIEKSVSNTELLKEAKVEKRTKFSSTMAIKEIIEQAKKALADLTGFQKPRGIGAKKTGKEWVVRVEITEKSSIPEGMDVLGVYDVRLGEDGQLLGYERRGLRKRADTTAEIEEG